MLLNQGCYDNDYSTSTVCILNIILSIVRRRNFGFYFYSPSGRASQAPASSSDIVRDISSTFDGLHFAACLPSRVRVNYDEGNSRLSPISAFIRGPLLFVTTLRNPNPSDSPSSASYSVSASSLRRLIHVYVTILFWARLLLLWFLARYVVLFRHPSWCQV